MLTQRTTRVLLLTGIVAAGSLTAGCGGSPAAPHVVRLDAVADGSLRFERSVSKTVPGRVAVEMINPSSIPHAVALRGSGVERTGQTVTGGGRSRVEAQLEPGRYTLFCPVAGHEQAGMKATLVVR